VELFFKDPIVTRTQNYLNKVVREFTGFSVQIVAEMAPRNVERVLTDQHRLGAVMVYNCIEEGLESMGVQPTNKFKQRGGLSRVGSNSMKKSVRYSNMRRSV
jgi:hypothetical protein